ncbi:hypothetical protein Hesp01_05520 [Herbidospora sp. NBRC 101105]|nr:hypothetical protein Hesp01_05520 [Herbidospora sp. NBRC 101105]
MAWVFAAEGAAGAASPEAGTAVVFLVTVTVTSSARAGGATTAPTEAVSVTPPRERRAMRDRHAGVVDRIAPWIFL